MRTGDTPGFVVGMATGNVLASAPTGIHTGFSNFLFADGHVKSVTGNAIASGWNNPTVGECIHTADPRVTANSQCSDSTIAGTFSIN